MLNYEKSRNRCLKYRFTIIHRIDVGNVNGFVRIVDFDGTSNLVNIAPISHVTRIKRCDWLTIHSDCSRASASVGQGLPRYQTTVMTNSGEIQTTQG